MVEWIREPNQFSVVPVKDFEKLDENYRDYILNNNYKVRYHGRKYMAKLCILGTEEFCEKEVERLINYHNNTELQKKISKTSNNSTLSALKEKENEIELKNHEIDSLKRNYSEMVSEYNNKISELNDEISKLKNQKGTKIFLLCI